MHGKEMDKIIAELKRAERWKALQAATTKHG
jgi:hypothetical protein